MQKYLVDAELPLNIVVLGVPKTGATKPVVQPVHHIVVIDCSGSMSSDLPKIRDQLKRKLPKLLGEKDVISIVWFSGKGEFGTLLEGEPIATLKDLSDVSKAIDRWLRPVGLTGFKEPLEEVKRLVEKVSHKGVVSMLFLTDGYDNQWGKDAILKAVESTSAVISASTFVEYGYYCNHPLLVTMAEKAGGALVFSEDFPRYEPQFEAAMQRKLAGGKRIEVDLKGDAPLLGFVWAADDGNLTTYSVEEGKVLVPERVETIYYVTKSSDGTKCIGQDEAEFPLYTAAALFAQRMQPDVVFPVLRALGDVRLIRKFAGCFGKQRYADFVDTATRAAFNSLERLVEGYDPSAVPNDDAFNVLTLLQVLGEFQENKVLLEDPAFRYSRIGRARVKDDDLSDKAKEIQTLLASANSKSMLKRLNAQLAEEIEKNGSPIEFKLDPIPDGVSISNLIYNETRPNISLQVRRTGKVTGLGLDSTKPSTVPDELPSFIFRNYAIVRDGLVNVEKLPCQLCSDTVSNLKNLGIGEALVQRGTSDVYDIDLSQMPILNRRMVKGASFAYMSKLCYFLTRARAGQKVYNDFKKALVGERKSVGFTVLYGEAGATWLKEHGITDYSGYNPKTKEAEATDKYVGKELSISIKGLSSLPKVDDVKKKMASGKLTASAALMAPYIKKVEEFLASDTYTKASNDPKAILEAWLDDKIDGTKKMIREYLYEASQIRMAIIVGQVWFSECASLDENTWSETVDGERLLVTAEMKEIEIPI